MYGKLACCRLVSCSPHYANNEIVRTVLLLLLLVSVLTIVIRNKIFTVRVRTAAFSPMADLLLLLRNWTFNFGNDSGTNTYIIHFAKHCALLIGIVRASDDIFGVSPEKPIKMPFGNAVSHYTLIFVVHLEIVRSYYVCVFVLCVLA